MFLSLFNMIFIALVRPFESSSKNNTEIYNEVTILAVSTHLYIFSDFVQDLDQQVLAGWSLIAIVLVNILYHMINMVCFTLKSLKLTL